MSISGHKGKFFTNLIAAFNEKAAVNFPSNKFEMPALMEQQNARKQELCLLDKLS